MPVKISFGPQDHVPTKHELYYKAGRDTLMEMLVQGKQQAEKALMIIEANPVKSASEWNVLMQKLGAAGVSKMFRNKAACQVAIEMAKAAAYKLGKTPHAG